MFNKINSTGFYSENQPFDLLHIETESHFKNNVHFSGTINGIDPSDVGLTAEPQMIYVTLSGSDTTGDGSYFKPYRTVAKAATVASQAIDRSAANQFLIEVGPGRFVETALPIFLPLGTTVKGVSEEHLIDTSCFLHQ